MALIIFKYVLPILLGYMLFLGISGSYLPFIRPRSLAKRPKWFLGLWTGISASVIMLFGLHIAYQVEIEAVNQLAITGLWLFGAAMIPGLLAFLWYRTKISAELADVKQERLSAAIDADDAAGPIDQNIVEELDFNELDETLVVDHTAEIFTEQDAPMWQEMPSDELLASELDQTQNFAIEPASEIEPLLLEQADATLAFENAVDLNDITIVENETVAITTEMLEDCVADDNSPDLVVVVDESSAKRIAELTDANTASVEKANELQDSLDAEIQGRKELETHLRATRRGLAELESESRHFEASKAAALAELEEELLEKTKRTSAAEARAEREAEKRAALETDMVNLREDALRARNEARVSTEARANALSTANKATTFARQAMEQRSRLETQLHEAESELHSRQQTVSSLIKALEKEKSRTQDEVTSMAKQLVLHEKQLQARRTLEEVSRTVDKKLSTRLVKKVAKARG